MTDRELLEAAARAAGIVGEWEEHPNDTGGIYVEGRAFLWNPLTDDGDAFRLAVALRMDIASFTHGVRVNSTDGDDCHEAYNTDPYAATRRAIVRAAAALDRA